MVPTESLIAWVLAPHDEPMGLVERRKTRRRPALSRASWLAVVWVALIGPEPASAQLTVLEGPPELVGSTFEAVNYEFAPQTFDVRGRLLRVERSDWDMSECPPTYVGAGEPAGSVILDVHPLGRCSLRDVSLAVRAVNAVAYLTYSMDIAHHFAPAPGRLQPHYAEAPPQARYGPTVDVTQGDMASFEKATRDPEHGIVVRVRPTPSLWEECFASPWYLVVQVVLTLQACACVELAAMRIEAFCRRAAGPYGRLPRVWLCLELALNLLRAAYYAVDPEGGRGVFSFGVGLLLRSGTFALGSVGTVIFVGARRARAARPCPPPPRRRVPAGVAPSERRRGVRRAQPALTTRRAPVLHPPPPGVPRSALRASRGLRLPPEDHERAAT